MRGDSKNPSAIKKLVKRVNLGRKCLARSRLTALRLPPARKASSLGSLARFSPAVLILSLKATKKEPTGSFLVAGAEGFEPPEWLDQNQLPYHLATPHYSVFTAPRFVLYILLSTYHDVKQKIFS